MLALGEGQKWTRPFGKFGAAGRVGGWLILFPFAFRGIVMKTRKALESETILTGHPFQAEKKYGLVGSGLCPDSGKWGGGNAE